MSPNYPTLASCEQYPILLVNFNADDVLPIIIFIHLLKYNNNCVGFVLDEQTPVFQYETILRVLEEGFD